jgi:protein-disulfide isomerase
VCLPCGAQNESERLVRIRVDEAYSLGKDDAPLTLVEFADYQCPYCRKFHIDTLPELRKNYIDTGKLRFVAMDLPLDRHQNATRAAVSVLCAGEQHKFWEMRDTLILHASNLAEDAIVGYAQKLELDTHQMKTCVASLRYLPKIYRDIMQAEAAGIYGTPSFVLGKTARSEIAGIAIEGAPPYAELDSVLKQLLSAND